MRKWVELKIATGKEDIIMIMDKVLKFCITKCHQRPLQS